MTRGVCVRRRRCCRRRTPTSARTLSSARTRTARLRRACSRCQPGTRVAPHDSPLLCRWRCPVCMGLFLPPRQACLVRSPGQPRLAHFDCFNGKARHALHWGRSDGFSGSLVHRCLSVVGQCAMLTCSKETRCMRCPSIGSRRLHTLWRLAYIAAAPHGLARSPWCLTRSHFDASAWRAAGDKRHLCGHWRAAAPRAPARQQLHLPVGERLLQQVPRQPPGTPPSSSVFNLSAHVQHADQTRPARLSHRPAECYQN